MLEPHQKKFHLSSLHIIAYFEIFILSFGGDLQFFKSYFSQAELLTIGLIPINFLGIVYSWLQITMKELHLQFLN